MSVPARILVVDDTPANIKLLRDLLASKGYEVSTAVDGEEALAKVAAEKPDLVLMDIQLPGINGMEAFRQVRADPGCAKIPVVAFTASVTPTDRSQISAAGFDAFISKPINLKEFLEAVRKGLEGRQP